MTRLDSKKAKRVRRHIRVRAKVKGTAGRPRLCIFRSSKHISFQLIDDNLGKTIIGFSDKDIKKGTKMERAGKLGELASKKVMEKGIKKIVFDRGGFRYHGRVQAFAEALRKGGLTL